MLPSVLSYQYNWCLDFTEITKYTLYCHQYRGHFAVSNPVCSPRFRASASVSVQKTAFATGVLPNIYAFHRYTRNSVFLYYTLAE